MDLFDHAIRDNGDHIPLATRVRPETLAEFVGQEQAVGPQSALGQMLRRRRLPSLILWGPPGTGKTTLARIIARSLDARFENFSAVTDGLPELRKRIGAAKERLKLKNIRTILFVDEIHRFNKAQQDGLLPHVEDGTLTLIGATTENPSFAVNPALRSRARLVSLEAMDADAIVAVLRRATEHPRGVNAELSDALLAQIAKAADHDARRALGLLEEWVWSGASDWTAFASELRLRHDSSGEDHFNVVSAFIKSMRGSDADAAIYYLMRMAEGGEDPRYISRRLMIFASEDIGLADSSALPLATATDYAARNLGMPECLHNLAHCTIYLARAPKSNQAYKAYRAAQSAIRETGALPVPKSLRNAATEDMRRDGYGAGYRNAHDEGGFAEGMEYLPEKLRGTRFVNDER